MTDQIRRTLIKILEGVEILVDSGDYAGALKILERLSEICPEDPGPYIKRAEILSTRGRTGEAHQILDLAEKRCDPSVHPRIWRCRAEVYESSGEIQESIDLLRKVITCNPGDAEGLLDLSRILMDIGNYRDAIPHLMQLLRIQPDSASIWGTLGMAYYNLGMYEEAVSAYDKALQIDPGNEVRLYNKGNALLDMGRYDDAILCFDRVLEANPERVEAWNNRGVALDRAGRLKEAEESFLRALSLKPDYILARKNITIVQAKMRGEDVGDDWLGIDTDEE